MESNFVLRSQDILDAVALENENVGKENQIGYNYIYFAIHTMQYTCLVISILLSHIAISHRTVILRSCHLKWFQDKLFYCLISIFILEKFQESSRQCFRAPDSSPAAKVKI